VDDFSGKVAVVTGGASGIGRSLVKELLAAGAKVVLMHGKPICVAKLTPLTGVLNYP